MTKFRLAAFLAIPAAFLGNAPTLAQVVTSTGTIRPPADAPAPTSENSPVATVAIATPSTTNAILRAGTPIALRLMEEITTKKKAARVGQRFHMEVASPIEVDGITVIPVGSPAEGEITGVRNKGMWGKSGHLEARALWVRVNGRQVRLSGTFDDKGVTGTAGVVAAIALVPIAGFFTTGTSAVLPKGGQISAFVDEDIELAIKRVAPKPMQIEAPAIPEQTPPTEPAGDPSAN